MEIKIRDTSVKIINAIARIGGRVTAVSLSYNQPKPVLLANGILQIEGTNPSPRITVIRCFWKGKNYRVTTTASPLIELAEGGCLVNPDENFVNALLDALIEENKIKE